MSEFAPPPPIDPEKEAQGISLAQEIASLRVSAKTDEDYHAILQKAKELKELFGIASAETSIEQAKELLGSDFLGAEAIEAVFGREVVPAVIPPIPFSLEELEKARDSKDQFLILRTDQVPADKLALPNTKRTLEKAPQTRWALVTKEILPDSVSKNYLQQTEQIIIHLEEQVFADREIPKEYMEAIAEFESQKEELRPLAESSDEKKWKPAAERLANLKITQLCRQTRDEVLYDLEVYHKANDQYLMPDKWTWTSSRASSGDLVYVGLFDAGGVDVSSYRPASSFDFLGVSFSRSL